ncbi:hypothetical protein CFELI_09180 [Corynebacterium felinum]|uniref:Uncharacterized protein n=1 Tax=Corynebacterium felinum TaxID=131318 RepID=A0ABU2BCM9_9CORY|nr:hypothetical protein [Corynebacterium felinum]WJY95440.1 hypothetical protein CFELI_09180 [Corynebacterium felinum]
MTMSAVVGWNCCEFFTKNAPVFLYGKLGRFVLLFVAFVAGFEYVCADDAGDYFGCFA